MTISADDRSEVRAYYTPLWLWNRLVQKRWEKAKVALREDSRRQNRLDVDHIVAYDLWQTKLGAIKAEPSTGETTAENIEDSGPAVNELGNSMLLEKNFNISKSNKPLKQFLDAVHEIKEHKFTVEEWATALDLKMPQVDSADTAIADLRTLFSDRSQKIRGDLEQFIRGTKARVDLEA